MSLSGTRPVVTLATAQTTTRSGERGDRDWVISALCRTQDPDQLFVSGAEQRKAISICRDCPVMQQCAAEALDNNIEYGVWGGLTERARRALLKKHPDVVSWADFLARQRGRSAASPRR
nr:WhiB family transcriptional regulator [Mycobacterium asiaticum]